MAEHDKNVTLDAGKSMVSGRISRYSIGCEGGEKTNRCFYFVEQRDDKIIIK